MKERSGVCEGEAERRGGVGEGCVKERVCVKGWGV